MKKVKFIYLIALAVTFFVSCDKNDDDATIVEPQQFGEIEDLATFHGNRESDIVIVNTQGGPMTSLDDDFLNEIRVGTQTEDVLYVNVHQAQTKNPSQFTESDITFQQAKDYDAQSISDLKKVISFFKELPNKKVYVLGISFGAFMTQELIAKHGIDVADGYLILVGRLDIDEEIYTVFSQGQSGGYIYDDEGNFTFNTFDQDTVEDRNMSRLAAGLGNNRYTTELSDISDLSKITYVYGDRDEQVGPLSDEETQFLLTRGASVQILQGGNHSDTIGVGLVGFLKSTFNIPE